MSTTARRQRADRSTADPLVARLRRQLHRDNRRCEAAAKLGRNPFDAAAVTDVEVARTLRPTAPKVTRQVRPVPQQPQRREVKTSSSSSGTSSDDDPEPPRGPRIIGTTSPAALAEAIRVLDREALRRLREQEA